jgi:hypothetical protein
MAKKILITLVIVAAIATMIGIQTQMSQYALAKHAPKHVARDPPAIPESHAFESTYSGYLSTEPNVAPGCQGNPSCTG